MSNDYLANYKVKVEYYLKQHENILAIAKLKTNKPLTESDVKELERILWNEVGSKEDYEKEYGDTPLGELVRSIVGLSMEAANDAFSQFLNNANLNSIVNHLKMNDKVNLFNLFTNGDRIPWPANDELLN